MFLQDDLKAMNAYMNKTALATLSFLTVEQTIREEPERFYQVCLGPMVELEKSIYDHSPNRESGFGRYDVMLDEK